MRLDRKALACAMIDKDLTQLDLSKICGLSRVTVSNIYCGKSCTYETGVKIAKALDMKLGDLLEKKGA